MNENSVRDPQFEELFRAGKIAIPLKAQADSDLNPQPNFLIIENMFDSVDALWPDASGNLVMTECINTYSYLAFREILEADPQRQRPREVRNCLLDNIGNQPVPEEMLLVVKNHNRLIDNAPAINAVLSMFDFRGFLKGFKLEIDTMASQNYLDYLDELKAEEEARKKEQEEAAKNQTPEGPAPTPEESV